MTSHAASFDNFSDNITTLILCELSIVRFVYVLDHKLFYQSRIVIHIELWLFVSIELLVL